MIKLSHRAQKMSPSATLAMAAKAAKMRSEGIDVISFATGEPDFDTPSSIRRVCKEALDDGLTHYPPSAGIPELRKTIAEKLRRENDLSYDVDEIVVTCGAKQAIFNALQVIVDRGDEVLIPAPYWVSYPEQVKLADGVPVIIPTTAETTFKVTTDMLDQFMTDRTKAIILNSPSNPTGSAYTKDELKRMGEFLTKRNVAIISDEIYEKIVYCDYVHTSIVAAHPPARCLTIVVNGVSKAYAMTGWRMGYAAGPREIISKMTGIVGQQITGIPPFVQRACIEALDASDNEIKKMRDEFKARRDIMLENLLRIPGISCPVPVGTFYLFPDVRTYLKRRKGINDSTALVEYLLEEARIATVGGDAFGSPGHIRFSYATSRDKIAEGMKRLKDALSKL